MKKILMVVLVLLFTFTLTGCDSFYSQEEVDVLIEESNKEFETTIEGLYDLYIEENEQDIAELQEKVDALQPTQVQRFMNDIMEYAITDGSLVFINLGTAYTGVVESYGYSDTYVYEALEPIDLIISVMIDNDLDFCYYPDGYFEDGECYELSEGTEIYNVSIEAGFFVLDFESWDEVNDSGFVIVITEDE